MRRAFLTLFLALPASAQSVADFGGTGCRLIPVEGQSQVADVICHNAVTSGEAWSEGAMVAGSLVVGLPLIPLNGRNTVTHRHPPSSTDAVLEPFPIPIIAARHGVKDFAGLGIRGQQVRADLDQRWRHRTRPLVADEGVHCLDAFGQLDPARRDAVEDHVHRVEAHHHLPFPRSAHPSEYRHPIAQQCRASSPSDRRVRSAGGGR